jgi:hypothetical protein
VYTLLAVNEFEHRGKLVRLCKIRNPWGNGEWTGAWADNSKEWTPQLKNMLNHTAEEDGTFFMNFEETLNQFNRLTVCCNPSPKTYKR